MNLFLILLLIKVNIMNLIIFLIEYILNYLSWGSIRLEKILFLLLWCINCVIFKKILFFYLIIITYRWFYLISIDMQLIFKIFIFALLCFYFKYPLSLLIIIEASSINAYSVISCFVYMILFIV